MQQELDSSFTVWGKMAAKAQGEPENKLAMVWWKSTTAARCFQRVKWRIPASLLVSHTRCSGLFQSICHRCMNLFTPSQRVFHPAFSAFVAVTCMPEHWQRKVQQLTLKVEEGTQEALASRLLCLFCFAQATCLCSGCQPLLVVEALTLKAPLSPCCCHLAWPSTSLTGNIFPQRATPLRL